MPFLLMLAYQLFSFRKLDILSGFGHWVYICPVKIPNFANFPVLDALTVFSH
jgi:hypothetical protein